MLEESLIRSGLHESGHQLELINQRNVEKTFATLVCRVPWDPGWRAMEDKESYVLWKGLVSGSYFQCLVNFPVPWLGKSQPTHCAVEIWEFLMSLAKQNVSEGTAHNRKLWVFLLWTACPQSRRKDTWLCVFMDIFPFKKSKAFLANIFPDSDLKEIHFFWLFCMNTTPQGYLLPTLRTFSGRSPHLEDSHFLCNGTQFPCSFHVSLLTLYSQHPWAKALSLFISYFTDFFFPPADI